MNAALPHRHFAFPWNVYAHAQMLQEGRAGEPHFGLFRDGETSLAEAQQCATELLLSRLPAPPSRILQAGVCPDTSSPLAGRGYRVTGIDAGQAARVRERLETFAAEAESFDVILLRESAQYFEPLALFNRALDLLAPSGSLLIIGEFALRRTDPGLERLQWLDGLVALAARFGFELAERQDLSALAAPTLDYWLRATALHRQKLTEDLGLAPQELDDLDAANRACREIYASGRYGYALLHFRKKTFPRWRLRLVEEPRVAEVLTLFERVFDSRMEAAIWQWKYGGDRGVSLGIWEGDRLVGHYGGMTREILYFGIPQRAVQGSDVMVEPSQRGVLTRKGPYFLMAATFHENYMGYGTRHLLGFGFPTSRHLRLAETHGFYADTGGVTEVSWRPLARRPFFRSRVRAYDPGNPADRARLDALWGEMAAELRQAVIGVRDADYIAHRYLRHPGKQYRVLWVVPRWGGRPAGLLVLRREGEAMELLDVVAPRRRIPLLVAHARRLAGYDGAARVYCWAGDGFHESFLCGGGTARALDIRIPANAWSAGPSPESLRNRWWVMSGDTDFR